MHRSVRCTTEYIVGVGVLAIVHFPGLESDLGRIIPPPLLDSIVKLWWTIDFLFSRTIHGMVTLVVWHLNNGETLAINIYGTLLVG